MSSACSLSSPGDGVAERMAIALTQEALLLEAEFIADGYMV